MRTGALALLLVLVPLRVGAQSLASESQTLSQKVEASESIGGTTTTTSDGDVFPVFGPPLPPMPRSFSASQGNASATTTVDVATTASDDAFRVTASFDSAIDNSGPVPVDTFLFSSMDALHLMNVAYNVAPGEFYGIYGTFIRNGVGIADPAAQNDSSFEITIADGMGGSAPILYQAGTALASPIGLAQGTASQSTLELRTSVSQLLDLGGEGAISESLAIEFELLLGAGATQMNPLLPTGIQGTVLDFQNAARRRWIDPVGADGFRFEMTGGSLFTGILGLPTGFGAPFQVEADGQTLGTFGPEDTIDFGAGVSAFTVSGITPSVATGDPLAFPIRLDFDTPTASFTMTALPEPGVALLLATGLLGLPGVQRRRRRPSR